MSLTVGSLFSGIGGLDLGLERAGMTVRWQVENDPYCCRVLAKHWPDVARYGDVKELDPDDLEPVDLVAGGFPCQPVSRAGRRRGADDERWLWPEMARVVGVVRPPWVLIENVPGLRERGLDDVGSDLQRMGYRGRVVEVTACSLGAPHTRERLLVVAHRADHHVEDHLSHSARLAAGAGLGVQSRGSRRHAGRHGWLPEPPLDRVAHGLSSRVVRPALHALGNAVVPQVAEWIGRRIVKAAA